MLEVNSLLNSWRHRSNSFVRRLILHKDSLLEIVQASWVNSATVLDLVEKIKIPTHLPASNRKSETQITGH
jgi:hypothetical protein